MSARSPRLVFRLMGRWWRIDVSDEAAIARSARAFVDAVTGRRDDLAGLRADARRSVAAAASAARSGGAAMLMVATELAPGVPMPVTLTVHDAAALRMSPSIGTAESDVLDTLTESLRLAAAAGIDTLVERRTSDAPAVRVHRFDAAENGTRRLLADYWCLVPASKRVVLVQFGTPLGDIPSVMLELFDSIVLAAHYDETFPGFRGDTRRAVSRGAGRGVGEVPHGDVGARGERVSHGL